jgi:hypothetical protein
LFAGRGGSSAGRASRSQCEGREFDPPPLHQDFLSKQRTTSCDVVRCFALQSRFRLQRVSNLRERGMRPRVCFATHRIARDSRQASYVGATGFDLDIVTANSSWPGFGAAQIKYRLAAFSRLARRTAALRSVTQLLVVIAANFFSRFRRFKRRATNGKTQIPLPRDFSCL